MVLEQQINILELFLKDHETLNWSDGVKILKTETFILNCNNMSQYELSSTDKENG